jgi:hypothetical protein
LLWAIIEGPTKGWSSVSVVTVGAFSVAALAGFIAWEAHVDHPMLNLASFRDRRFSIAAASESLRIFGLMGVLFLQTQFLQFDLDYSPLQAGLRILPAAATICITAPLSPIIARRIGIKLVVAAGLAAIAGGLWQISAVRWRQRRRHPGARRAGRVHEWHAQTQHRPTSAHHDRSDSRTSISSSSAELGPTQPHIQDRSAAVEAPPKRAECSSGQPRAGTLPNAINGRQRQRGPPRRPDQRSGPGRGSRLTVPSRRAGARWRRSRLAEFEQLRAPRD